jgi:hypothetical protein
MKKKPVGVDVLLALGGGKHPPSEPGKEPDPNDPNEDSENELPPDFEKAWQEYHDHPSAQSFWDAVEACTSGDKVSSKGY